MTRPRPSTRSHIFVVFNDNQDSRKTILPWKMAVRNYSFTLIIITGIVQSMFNIWQNLNSINIAILFVILPFVTLSSSQLILISNTICTIIVLIVSQFSVFNIKYIFKGKRKDERWKRPQNVNHLWVFQRGHSIKQISIISQCKFNVLTATKLHAYNPSD